MNNEELNKYKSRLIKEKEKIKDTLSLMKKNQTIDSNSEISSELSFYDNHPGDLGDEIYDIERGRALKGNELSIVNKIDVALASIESKTYGICRECGKKISEERLEFIPYAIYCINCQNKISERKPTSSKDRPIEETVLGKPFAYGYNDYKNDTQFDAEDSYQAVARYNNLKNTIDYYEDDDEYTDPMERISNEQYKNQLPD